MSLLDLKKRLPELTLTFGLLLVCAGMGHGWLGRGPSDEELIAATARYGDVLRGIEIKGSVPHIDIFLNSERCLRWQGN